MVISKPCFPKKGKEIRDDGIFKIPFQHDISSLQQLLGDYRQNEQLSESYAPPSEGGVNKILHRFR
jgi:hypothetical protein